MQYPNQMGDTRFAEICRRGGQIYRRIRSDWYREKSPEGKVVEIWRRKVVPALFLPSSLSLETLFSLEGAMNGSFYEHHERSTSSDRLRTSAGLFSFFYSSVCRAFKRKRNSRLSSSPSFLLAFRLCAPADFALRKASWNSDFSARRFLCTEINLRDFCEHVIKKVK